MISNYETSTKPLGVNPHGKEKITSISFGLSSIKQNFKLVNYFHCTPNVENPKISVSKELN